MPVWTCQRFEPGSVYESTPSKYWDHRCTNALHSRLKKLQKDLIHPALHVINFYKVMILINQKVVFVYVWQVYKCTLFFHEISLEFLVPTGIFCVERVDGRHYNNYTVFVFHSYIDMWSIYINFFLIRFKTLHKQIVFKWGSTLNVM